MIRHNLKTVDSFGLTLSFINVRAYTSVTDPRFCTNIIEDSTPVTPPPPEPIVSHLVEVSASDPNFLLMNDNPTNRTSFGDSYHQSRYSTARVAIVLEAKKMGSGYTTAPKTDPPSTWSQTVAPFDDNDPSWPSYLPSEELEGTVNFGFRYREGFYDYWLTSFKWGTTLRKAWPAFAYVQKGITLPGSQTFTEPFTILAPLGRPQPFRVWVYHLQYLSTELFCDVSDSSLNPSSPHFDRLKEGITTCEKGASNSVRVSPLGDTVQSYQYGHDSGSGDAWIVLILKP